MTDGSRSARFNAIYSTNEWNSEETRSGRGSELACTRHVMRIVDVAVIFSHAKTLLDAGCGEANWLGETKVPLDHIYGVDIVDDPALQRQWEQRMRKRASRLSFVTADIVTDPLPKVDIILCRDVLVHLSNAECTAALANFVKSGSRYLLATSFQETSNIDIEMGQWRKQNLEAPPFNLPAPVKRWNEMSPMDGGRHVDKCLFLWCLSKLAPK
ncbi:methyltransferase domain-containing protein [Anderseniella sp. Alg231-50]|uniref:methyltransferase domain-containing protein n=1 Tax=Anderseniella sp. Alg231-50 TaxID=1922226 RepID=UPI000D551C30